jgi:hypothetical protein
LKTLKYSLRKIKYNVTLYYFYRAFLNYICYFSGNVGVFKDDKRTEKTHEDPVSMAIGEFGRWQAMLTLILSLLNLPCTWHIFVLTFQGADTDFWCTPPPGVLNRISVDEWKILSGVISESPTTKVSYKEF